MLSIDQLEIWSNGSRLQVISIDQSTAKYRPISNLNNISKILERLFLSRFYPHVTSSPHFNRRQSAYRKFHSTESALLHTFDSIYRSADQSKPTFLLSLDLSAAFDTIDHSILLNRLSTSFGVHGSALAWLTSYLSDRSQTIRIGSAASGPSNCQSGVSLGSVLGLILFFFSSLRHIISSLNISYQQYADDSQLYISLVVDSIRASLDRFETCLSAVRSWLCTNGLCLNTNKQIQIQIQISIVSRQVRLNNSGHSPASSHLPLRTLSTKNRFRGSFDGKMC